MKGYMHVWLDGWSVRWMAGWMNAWMDGQSVGWMAGWIDGILYWWIVDSGMEGLMASRWLCGQSGGWLDVWMDSWVDRMVGWMTARLH